MKVFFSCCNFFRKLLVCLPISFSCFVFSFDLIYFTPHPFPHVFACLEKRTEQGGTDQPILSPPSAPSSLIQQPDSYYGSFIEDSFVGDFVGEYDNGEAGNYQPLRLDEESQNLVMMNPNDATGCMSHTHEIEFDFDSFGPESIIYAGNGQQANNANIITNGLNGKENNIKENGTKVQHEEDVEHKSLEDDSGFDKENVHLSSASLDDKSQCSSSGQTTTTTTTLGESCSSRGIGLLCNTVDYILCFSSSRA